MGNKDKQSELSREIRANLKEDREKIKEFRELLIKAVSISADGESDPLAKISITEGYAKICAELSKNNSLLVEILKLEKKNGPSDDDFSEEETDTLFDEIEGDVPDTEEEDPN